MKIRFVALGALLALLPASAWALNDTPAPTPAGTSTPASTASPDGATVRSQSVPAEPSAKSYSKAQTFEAGIQVGTTAAGASSLEFIKRLKFTVDPIAMTLPGQTTLIQGAATGAVAGDFVACSLPIASAAGAVVKSVAAGTDVVNIELVAISDGFANVGAVDIVCVVIR